MKKKTIDVVVALILCINIMITSFMQVSAAAITTMHESYAEGPDNLSDCTAVTVHVKKPSINGTANELSAAVMEDTSPDNRWGITLTEEETELLAKIVWLEACGEPEEGQEAVVEVIFNRMASNLFPNTLYDVLSQRKPLQFSSWPNRDKAAPTDKEYQSIANVLNGETNLLRADTLYFSTTMQTSNLDVQICCHYFCY